MALGDFLVAYLKRAGVAHIFGLPGDLVLGLFHRFGRARDLEIVTFSHEPSVGFAADGYARSTRRLGVVCVTYGAGGHNVVNPVAGAYAEQVPILVVSGGPGEAEQKLSGVHHQVKDVEAQCRIFSEVTCAARILRHPDLAAEEVHEVMRTIATEHRPAYLEIHRDMVDVIIPVPKHIVEWDGSFPRPASDERKLSEAVSDSVARLRAARRPILIGGLELYRERAERDFLSLAEKLRAPVVTTILAKGVFPMDHPLHMGVHIGPFSPPAIQKRVRDADLVLSLGNQLTDMNLGAARPQVRRQHSVWAVSNRVNVSFHTYTDVTLKDFVSRLGRERLPRFRERVAYHDNLKRTPGRRKGREQPLSINDMLLEVNDFLEEHEEAGYHVFAESGDMLFGGLEVRQRKGGLYFAQGYYASMGFAVPAALGSQIGTGRRPLVLCGDGGFQMTGPEVSHAPRRGLSPIVVILNNAGWGIFRPVSPRRDLLEIPPWPYAELAQKWGGVGIRAQTRSEFRDALRAAHAVKDFVVVECVIDPEDLSPVTRRYIRASVRKAGASAGRHSPAKSGGGRGRAKARARVRADRKREARRD
jgi:indolepyruvate decarboxylase